jgi:capsular exopolysaccharide synthesis family protein
MTRVFEALQREQESRNKEMGRDSLAAETGAPEEARKMDSEAAAAEFELPSVIGSPLARRSDEGIASPAPDASNTSGNTARIVARNTARNTGGEIAVGQKTNHHAAPSNAPMNNPVTGLGANISVAVEDVRSRQTETQRLREEPALQTVARPSREIPIERLVPSRLHQRLILLTEPTATECEQYRTLRTQLFHAAEKRETQVVVITSALAGEGKTSTALNLAIAIAQSKENRVLVIDGDLRRPNVASYLGMRPKAGLSEVLKGEIGVLDSVVCVEEPELYVLPVSHEATNPTELLSSERFAEAISELRDYFDFILIDSPPVLPFADSRLLSNHSDAVILVIRAEKAPYETVEKAVEILPSGRVLGVVLNGAERIRETDYYDYYYNYTQREQGRGALFDRLTSRVRESWLGRKMKL